MIKKIIEFSANNRVLVILLVAVAVVAAVYTLKADHAWMPYLTCQTPRSSCTPAGTEALTSLKTRSPIPLSRHSWAPPAVKAIRGFSDFGFSYVYVIFQDGTDIYWARSRVLEYLSKIQGSLPAGSKTELGPDATGVGWIFQYVLLDKSGKHDLAQLRTFQDWYLRYALQSVPGVAEVAGIGGFQKQYQVTIDPNRLQSYRLSLMDVAEAIKKSNNEMGGRLIEWSGTEFMVRGKGYVKSTADLDKVVVKTNEKGTPVLLKDVATIALGPQIRRGVLDFNGEGDAVGGIVVMRHGENALNVIRSSQRQT